MKCDEGKPSCQRCVKAGRKCEGYATSPEPANLPVGQRFVHYVESTSTALSRSPSPQPGLDTPALRSLDYYLNATALYFGEPFGIDLFSKDLSCFMQNDKAVRHSIIALAAFHENFLHPTKSTTDNQRRLLALDHYSQSIQTVVHLNQRNQQKAMLTTLITCLVYCCIESIQGHFVSAMRHIASGIRLLAEQEDSLLERERLGNGISKGFIDKMRRMFISLGTQAMSMEESEVSAAVVQHLQSAAEEHVGYFFDSPEQALADIAQLMNDTIRLATWAESCENDSDFPNHALVSTGDRLDRRFEEWTRAYDQLLTRSSHTQYRSDCSSQHIAFLILRVNQLMTRIVLSFKYQTSQTRWDEYLEGFKAIVSTSEDLLVVEAQQRAKSGGSPWSSDGQTSYQGTFSLTLGIVPALFLTCTRCRDRVTRHRALDILKTQRRRESVWDSQVVAVVAERIIQVEEESTSRYWQERGSPSLADSHTQQGRKAHLDSSEAQVVPEEARIHSVVIDWLDSENRAQVFLMEKHATERHKQVVVWNE